MITFSSVAKRYPPAQEALREVSFTINPGEFVFLTGASGAGKSTLLKLIAAIETPTAGTVLVNGQNIGAMKKTAIPYLRRNLGLIFQDQKLLYDRSAFDNVLLPLLITGFPPADAAKRVRAALDKVGLLNREKALPIALSGGEQQRLAIARAVVARPSVVLADEPTANLDADTAAQVTDVLLSFHQVGVTMLIATHDEATRARVAARTRTRTLTLERGRLWQASTPMSEPAASNGDATTASAKTEANEAAR
jgi:cell division transport system ATP-binding protein